MSSCGAACVFHGGPSSLDVDWTSWGMSVMEVDGEYHGFVAEMVIHTSQYCYNFLLTLPLVTLNVHSVSIPGFSDSSRTLSNTLINTPPQVSSFVSRYSHSPFPPPNSAGQRMLLECLAAKQSGGARDGRDACWSVSPRGGGWQEGFGYCRPGTQNPSSIPNRC